MNELHCIFKLVNLSDYRALEKLLHLLQSIRYALGLSLSESLQSYKVPPTFASSLNEIIPLVISASGRKSERE